MFIALLVALGCTPTDSGTDAVVGDWIAPDNRWASTTPPVDLVATGYDEGDVPPDVRLPDQFGDEVSLWQFYGNLVVVNVAPMWCAPCQELARGVEAMVQDYADEDLVFIELVAETITGETPSQEHAVEWAESFGIESTPVLADTEGFYINYVQGGAYPIVFGIGPDMVIFEGGFVASEGEDVVRAFIEDNL